MLHTDILIIGGGIAGLSLAAKAAKWLPHLQITIITKDELLESNTRYAQGGIAIAIDASKDSFQQHVNDTLIAGDGLCKEDVVRKVVEEGPDRLRELIEWGVQFDQDATGKLALGREGGHTAHRIIHYKDATGFQIANSLLKHLQTLSNVTLLDHCFAIDLMIRDNRTCGAVAIDLKQNVLKTFSSRITVLATGGIGQIYATTTNPIIATGDGIAMAHRAGAKIRDMEFIQFHPTAFFSPTDNPSFLISEAMRGFGAYLRSVSGDRFLFNYDNRGELASRDIISKAIHSEILRSGSDSVFLDCRHLPQKELQDHFPTIYNRCLEKGIDIATSIIPVAPAAHYLCGGIEVDIKGRTSVKGLYACGECSYTGLHGANRLASNSLLEALVYAHEIFLDIERNIHSVSPHNFSMEKQEQYQLTSTEVSWVYSRRMMLRQKMSEFAGIVRTQQGLFELQQFLCEVDSDIDGYLSTHGVCISVCELKNMVDVALLVAEQSLRQNQNRGTYFNSDLTCEKN